MMLRLGSRLLIGPIFFVTFEGIKGTLSKFGYYFIPLNFDEVGAMSDYQVLIIYS
jgi:hypothetical protein